MRAELWGVLAVILAIAEVVIPGTFLIFFSAGAVLSALLALGGASTSLQLMAFIAGTGAALLAGNSLYRRLRSGVNNSLGTGPIGEPGIVEQTIVNGRGKVRVRDISWLATGPDLAQGTPVVVTGRNGTLLVVAHLNP